MKIYRITVFQKPEYWRGSKRTVYGTAQRAGSLLHHHPGNVIIEEAETGEFTDVTSEWESRQQAK